MARINFVVPRLQKMVFSGGLVCILEYAHGLTSRGHEVTLVPMAPSAYPEWFSHQLGTVLTGPTLKESLGRILQSFAQMLRSGDTRNTEKRRAIRRAFSQLCLLRPGLFDEPIRWGIAESYVLDIAPQADITVATSFETVRPAYLLTGKKFYFPQHFEVYFSNEFDSPIHAHALAEQSYNLGLNVITNSSWLRDQLISNTKVTDADVCVNAIDHNVFYGVPKLSTRPGHVVVISYGGRHAQWKGFREMAQGMAIARQLLPEIEIEWRVYGDALVLPGEITPYTPLGFLSPSRLSDQYRQADILLSASWYESFPLFPIEAMACGLPVITTSAGTEDYAVHTETAEIVRARDPESIADGLVKLIRDDEYRLRIARAGHAKAFEFTWDRSVERLEQILLRHDEHMSGGHR